jgi:hypothetical protein
VEISSSIYAGSNYSLWQENSYQCEFHAHYLGVAAIQKDFSNGY